MRGVLDSEFPSFLRELRDRKVQRRAGKHVNPAFGRLVDVAGRGLRVRKAKGHPGLKHFLPVFHLELLHRFVGQRAVDAGQGDVQAKHGIQELLELFHFLRVVIAAAANVFVEIFRTGGFAEDLAGRWRRAALPAAV